MSNKKGKITPEMIKAAKALYENFPIKKGRKVQIARILGISSFTMGKIMQGGFTYDGYRELVEQHYVAQKARAKRTSSLGNVPEETHADFTRETNYLYRDKLVEQMGELVSAVRDLVTAWNARPETPEYPNFEDTNEKEMPLVQPRTVRV